jgi:hypothetical protein
MMRAEYTGDGREFHNGIPARSLSTEEVAALSEEQRAVVEKSPLYKLVRVRPARTKKEKV